MSAVLNTITTINVNGKTLISIPVPKDATHLEILESGFLRYFLHSWKDIPLPKGNYEYIGKLSNVTEAQVIPYVENNGQNCWFNYDGYSSGNKYTKTSALDSFYSLLKVNGVKCKFFQVLPLSDDHIGKEKYNALAGEIAILEKRNP